MVSVVFFLVTFSSPEAALLLFSTKSSAVLTKRSAASGDENVLVIIQKLCMRTIISTWYQKLSSNVSGCWQSVVCYPLVSNSSLKLNQVTNWRTSTFVCKRGVIKSRTSMFRWGFPWASAPLKFCTVFACQTTQTIFKVAVAWKQKNFSVKVLSSIVVSFNCEMFQYPVKF